MNLDFLKNFGQMIGSGVKTGVGAVKSGIGKGVGGIKTGIGKLGEMGEDDDDEGYGDGGGNNGFNLPNLMKQQRQRQRQQPMPMTPGFNPDAAMPSLKAPVMGGDSGVIGHDPRLRNLLPQLARPDAPGFEPIRDSVDIRAQSPGGQIDVTDHQTQTIPLRSPSPMVSQSFGQQNIPMVGRAPQGQMDRRQDVPIPQLPGHRGEPIPYNEMDAAKWDHVYGKMRREPDVRRPDGSYQIGKEKGVGRSWKTALANSVLAMSKSFNDAGGYRNPDAWKAGLAGGAVGGVGSYVAPQAGEEVNFDWAHRPEIEDRMQRQQKEEDRGLDVRRKNAEIEGIGARNKATIAGMKDAELERRKTDSLIKLNEAKRQAVASGQAKMVEIEDENGQIRIVRVNNDGSVDLGGSGRAAMNQDRIESREKISGNQIKSREDIVGKQIGSRERIVNTQQRGATGRTGMTQAGQDRRQKERLGAQYGDTYVPPVGSVPNLFPEINKPSASGKVATQQNIQDYAKKNGVSVERAREIAISKGYEVR